jgi:NAD(P)H-nitrite reductase large subunit
VARRAKIAVESAVAPEPRKVAMSEPVVPPGPIYICRCEEITADEVRAAIAAGARGVNDVKRRTRAGMGLCQGIFCVPTIVSYLHAELQVPQAEIAPMTARPPVRPIPLELLAESE